MIIDLRRFITEEKPYWTELKAMLDRSEEYPDRRMTLDEAKRFHYLYQRASADLAKLATFSAEPDTHRYLESMVARAYGEVHETRGTSKRPRLGRWFLHTFPGPSASTSVRFFCPWQSRSPGSPSAGWP